MKSRLKLLPTTLACLLLLACKSMGPLPEQGRTGTADKATPAPAVAAAATGLPESLPFHLEVKESPWTLPTGLHSFAFGQADGKWLFVGGRTNGFHRTSTKSRTFPSSSSNKQLVVFEPSTGKTSSMELPAELMHLSATNMEHDAQDDGMLYFVGGYGSTCASDDSNCYQTYPKLTVIKVKDAIEGVLAGNAQQVAASISSIENDCFRVTGGVLRKVGGFFYLVFGQNYAGRYSDGNVGAYTEEIRRFQIGFEGGKPVLSGGSCKAWSDATAKGTSSQYHRRDLNVTTGITPSGKVGLSVWGGVFTANDGGWVNPIFIEPRDAGELSIQVDTTFSQKTNLYECANLLMYDPGAKVMYTTLFGGISDYYYDQKGALVPGNPANYDYWLPFTNIISTLGRSANGVREYVQPVDQGLPNAEKSSQGGFLTGANGEFVLAPGLEGAMYSPHILDYSKLPGDGSVLLGYIVGGIRATASRASEDNPTYANKKIYEVRLIRH